METVPLKLRLEYLNVRNLERIRAAQLVPIYT
jgi:hypothetical protein